MWSGPRDGDGRISGKKAGSGETGYYCFYKIIGTCFFATYLILIFCVVAGFGVWRGAWEL
jgi:hypothetical protein